jgi:hypothetical protein
MQNCTGNRCDQVEVAATNIKRDIIKQPGVSEHMPHPVQSRYSKEKMQEKKKKKKKRAHEKRLTVTLISLM